jgi:HK97 gp10 family phage protein
MKTIVRLEGFADLERELQRLGKVTTQKASLRRALRKAAQPVADMAQSLAPRDTDTLQVSVGIGTKLTKRQARLHRKMHANDRAAVEMFVGAGGLARATQMEFGNFKDAPQPFMRPAWDAEGMATLDRLKTELWADIQREIARQERRAARRATANS